MSRRSRAREVALQILYREDLNPKQDHESIQRFAAARLRGNKELVAFAVALVNGVLRNRDELDQLLAARAENWSLERMAVTDRNVLRLGSFEILYTDTPGPVAINEAVELSKRFGSSHSSQFVNGVLDRFLSDRAQD
jgi:N utilization substance protein B